MNLKRTGFAYSDDYLKEFYINPNTETNVVWTNANATEHMGEYVGRFGETSFQLI